MTAGQAFLPPALTLVVGVPVIYLGGISSGWVGLALGLGLLVAANVVVWIHSAAGR